MLQDIYNEKAFNLNKMSDYRRNSLAQKLRKDLLNSLIYRPFLKEQNIALHNQIEKIMEVKFFTIEDLMEYNFKNYFEGVLSNPIKPVMKKLKETKEANNVINLFNEINNPQISIFIHGSHADGKITNYSDIDVSIFIKKNEKIDFTKIRNDIFLLNNQIKLIDLESHHSIFVNLELDLDCYPESFMPLEVLRKAFVPKDQIFNPKKIRFSTDIALDSLFRISETIKKLILQNKINNSSNIKNIISSYFMMLILKDEIVTTKYRDKKTIFNEFILNNKEKNYFEIFKICSEIRKKWPYQNNNIEFGVSNIFVNKIKEHSEELIKEVIKSSNFKYTLSQI